LNEFNSAHGIALAYRRAFAALSSLVLGRTVQLILLYIWLLEKSQRKVFFLTFFTSRGKHAVFRLFSQFLHFYMKAWFRKFSTKDYCFSKTGYNISYMFFTDLYENDFVLKKRNDAS
jgi:hypothetical protein